MGSPLERVKVLDFTNNLPGPYATFVLRSLGAEVIKVESPRGDPARHMRPFFDWLNRGKQSVVLDLRDEDDQSKLQALVEWADVLVEGFRPGVMERLGCGPDQARAWNPDLIYCSISAFGQEGPRRREPAHDLNLQALSGVCHLERDADGRPRASALPIADLSTSLAAVASICAQLNSGEGAVLDVAMSDAVLSFAWMWGEGIDLAGPAREQLTTPGVRQVAERTLFRTLDREGIYALPHYGLFQTRDRRWLAIGIVDENHFWKALVKSLGLGFLGRLPVPARTALGPVLRRWIARRIRKKTLQHWLDVLVPAEVPVTPVLSPAEALNEPQYRARGLTGSFGVRAPLPGARPIEDKAPALGEHTDAVLERLGIEVEST